MSKTKFLRKKQLLKLVDRLPGTIYQYREWISGRCTFPYSTPAIEEIFFATPKALAKDGSFAWKCICSDSIELVRKAFAESAADLSEVEVTFQTCSPQDRIHWIHSHAVPERLRDGSTLWHGYMENVTAEYEAQETAKQRAAMLNVLFDNLPDHLYYMDRESRFLGVNQACCKYHNKSPDEITGKVSKELYDSELGKKLYEEEQELMAQGKTHKKREKHVHPDGSITYLESVKSPLKSKSGRIIGLAGISRDITPQVQHEEMLNQARLEAEHQANLMRVIVENLPGRMYYKDRQSRFVLANSACVQYAGLSSMAELVGKSDVDVLDNKAQAQRLYDAEQKIMAEGTLYHEIEEFLEKDGSVTHYEATKCPLRNKDGNVIGLVGISRDITDQVKNKQKAEETAALVTAIFENIPDLIYYKDRELRFLAGNNAFVQRMGANSIEELVGKTDYDILPKKLADELHKEEEELIKKGQGIIHNRKRFEEKDGRPVYREFIKCLIKNQDGEIIGVVGSSRDVTHQVENEEALIKAKKEAEQSASFIKAIFDNMEDQFYCKDRNAKVIASNKAWMKARGVESIDELLGKTDIDIHPAPLGQQLFDNEQRQMETGEVTRIRERHVRKDGTVQYLESIKCPMRNDQGEVIGLAGVSRDITKQVENEKILIEAQQEAEAANKAKSAFLAMMSHEIRTPMNGVIGAASLILGTDLTPQQEEFVHTIQVSGENLLTIINDILDYSKIEAGKIELEHEAFNLRECIEDAFDLFVQPAAKKNVELLYYVDTDVPKRLIGDITRLRQILVNLLGNAIKFTENGEVSLKVHNLLSDEARGSCQLQFDVHDTGVGIPEEHQDRLFQAFTQADSSSTRKYGGTGLGLTISRKLTELMNGRIWFESEVGKGSTFSFTTTLPVTDQPEEKTESLPVESLRGKHALIVDDNETNRWLLSDQLAQWGMLSEAFEQPEKALEHLKNSPHYDIALVDFQMPGMNGGDWAKEVYKNKELSNLPIIILSSSYEHIPSHPSISARLSKPVKVHKLCSQILQTLGHKKQEEVSRKEPAGSQIRPKKTRTLRILVAEDNSINQRIVQMMLQRLGYENPVLVENGEAAVAAIMDAEYDVILMDVQMPHMNGLEASRLIREQTGQVDKPWIIALTAGVMEEERTAAKEAGMNAFLAKPIVIDQLDNMLAEREIL